jgi:basic membrane protein A
MTAGFTFADPVKAVAEKNPNAKYMIIDVDYVTLPNVLNAVFAEHEGSYLVGVAAALKAQADGIKDPKFGFIGGIASSTITKFEVGYVQGILSVLPNAKIVDYYVGSWDNPDLAKTQAKNWYDSGVYIIYCAAGASGNGGIAQAKEYRNAGKNVWVIGVDSDQFADGVYNDAGDSAVLTSMLKMVDTASYDALQDVKNGTFKAGVRTLNLRANGVDYAKTNKKALPAAITSQIDAVKTDVISGKVKVAATYAEAKALPGFPQDLNAKDN